MEEYLILRFGHKRQCPTDGSVYYIYLSHSLFFCLYPSIYLYCILICLYLPVCVILFSLSYSVSNPPYLCLYTAMIVVVKLEGQPFLCRTDEVGEICVSGAASGDQYWGLQGMTNSTFRVQPLLQDSQPLSNSASFVRTGLLGFLGPVQFSISVRVRRG